MRWAHNKSFKGTAYSRNSIPMLLPEVENIISNFFCDVVGEYELDVILESV